MSEQSSPPAQARPGLRALRMVPGDMVKVLLMVAAVVVVIAYALPRLSGGGRAILPRIVDNLKQIELAKAMWVEDHSPTGSVHLAEQGPGSLSPPTFWFDWPGRVSQR